MRRSATLLLGAMLGALLAACASNADLALAEEPGYQAGYGDGCRTASEEDKSFSTRRARDDYAFANDRAYAAGWRQGYIQCGGSERPRNDGGRILGEENEY
jgi:hypothetical protein